jgi:hypothetical protein
MERLKAFAGNETVSLIGEAASFAWRQCLQCRQLCASCFFPPIPIAELSQPTATLVPNEADLFWDEAMAHKDRNERQSIFDALPNTKSSIPTTIARHLDGLFARHPLVRHSAVCKAPRFQPRHFTKWVTQARSFTV